jgi:hypothetical protein
MKLLLEQWRKYITEDWRDTSWETDDGKVSIGQVIDYLEEIKEPIIPVNVEELSQQFPTLPTDGEERISKAEFGEYQTDKATGEKKWVVFPIMIVKFGGKYQYVADGNHRLQKAINDKDIENIEARILDLDNPKTPEVFKKVLG